MHIEDFLIRRFQTPRCTGVYIDLYLIQNSGTATRPPASQRKEIAAREPPPWRARIDPALPAGRGASDPFLGDNEIINGGHGNIGRCGLSGMVFSFA